MIFGSVGEGKGEESKDKSVGGLSVNCGLDEGVPFLDKRAEVVSGGFHSVEVGQGNSSLGFAGVIDNQSNFLGGQGRSLIQISEVNLKYSSLESIRGQFLTS